jgi:hypothetical protein
MPSATLGRTPLLAHVAERHRRTGRRLVGGLDAVIIVTAVGVIIATEVTHQAVATRSSDRAFLIALSSSVGP